MKRFLVVVPAVFALGACSTDDPADKTALPASAVDDDDGAVDDDDDTNASSAGDAGPMPEQSFYADVLPLLEQNCVPCHQSGGIAPFALDSYEAAETWADAIAQVTKERTMPPWGAVSDGSCGDFRDSLALSDEEISTFGDWAKHGMTPGPERETAFVDVPALEDAISLKTPLFEPVPEGSADAENDEYRCFPMDSPTEGLEFITGYSVVPGTPELVHHVVAFIVNPEVDSDFEGRTNGEVMAELDAASPDRDGWPCLGAAGEGVAVSGVPVVWAPGQGVMQFPAGSGAPLTPTDKVVLQVHYNLEDPRSLGKSDQTEVQFTLTDSVERVGLFMVPDGLLDTYFSDEPDTLEPGLPSVEYQWRMSVRDIGLDSFPDLQLAGIMPHMHELGHRYSMGVIDGEQDQCAVAVNDWDFHWQRMYFYEEPISLSPEANFEVTCDFDTLARSEPVFPGWGTENEMCAAIMYVTTPLSAFLGE
jgi:hypothetical protein